MFFLLIFVVGFLFGETLTKIIKYMANLIISENNVEANYFYEKNKSVAILVKFLSGAFLNLCCFKFGLEIKCLFVFLFLCALIIISIIDCYFMIIFDEIIFFLALLGSYFAYINFGRIKFFDRLIGLILISGVMCLINLFKKNNFGFGDIKLMAVSGFIFGIEKNFLIFGIALLSASVFCVFMFMLNKKQFTDRIAFGPYICLAIAINFFYGNEIILQYKNFFT